MNDACEFCALSLERILYFSDVFGSGVILVVIYMIIGGEISSGRVLKYLFHTSTRLGFVFDSSQSRTREWSG